MTFPFNAMNILVWFYSHSCSFQSHHGLIHQFAIQLQQLLWNFLLLSSEHGVSSEAEECICACGAATEFSSTHMHQH